MSVLRKLKGSLDMLSAAFSNGHLSTGHCKRCGRDTRWEVNLARGYFRCIECGSRPGEE